MTIYVPLLTSNNIKHLKDLSTGDVLCGLTRGAEVRMILSMHKDEDIPRFLLVTLLSRGAVTSFRLNEMLQVQEWEIK